jgi:hypothetical protein
MMMMMMMIIINLTANGPLPGGSGYIHVHKYELRI